MKHFKKFAFPDQPLIGYGRQHEMMKKYNLDQKSIIKYLIKYFKVK